ncbi:hypothetical protein BOTBODRAFT_185910 [Botryobasidium botryosum FD-172 SS1]|uniref:Uncharacterized protein n=1 Tax=Botryobasidium botryosum (strain FD-172 SS1) TaxID=930990 RepID=A0A067MNP0_BOTB1|nr:hypothetical protein BOTBODRAFT_185910 [Botryobasidium botryosum FD-172 SS1]
MPNSQSSAQRGSRGRGRGHGRGRGGHSTPSGPNPQPSHPVPPPNPLPPASGPNASASSSSGAPGNISTVNSEALDELHTRIEELLARATQAEQALAQHVQQSAGAAAAAPATAGTANSAANGEANAIVPRPHGSAGDGFSLQNAMGLENDRAQYKAIQRMIKSLVNRADIPSTIHFRHIDPVTLGKIHRIARQRQPYLARFQHNWATDEFIVMLLKSRRKTARRHRQAERALEEEELTASAASPGVGTSHQSAGAGAGGNAGGNGSGAGQNNDEWSD